MDFIEVLALVRKLLQEHERVTYRVLKRQFGLDDESLEDLKEQLIDADRVAVDEDGRILVWTGDGKNTPQQSRAAESQSPASYTPPHLAERILAEQAAMESRGAVDGERKTITALFADLKGSTALIEGLDPEDARAIIDPALQLMMDAVHRYDGYVAQALGDGIFALFGAPIAHEDHPQRALYAALRMQEEMRGYADTLREQGHPPLMMRVGLNTGEVVVRSIRKDDLHADYVPVGHATNLAARMEQLAAPGSILVTAYTHKLTDGYFEFKDLGQTQIKGVEEPLHVYEVLGAGPLRTRLQVSARRGLTRFVGRHSELDQLQRALEQAKAGHGQIVGVMGEPGLGKSRLFHEFVGAVHEPPLRSRSGCLVLEALSVSHGKASPYLPLIELLKTYFQIEPTDDERTRKEKVAGRVLILDRSLEDTLPYLFSLLGIEDPQSSLQQMDAQVRRQRTFEALKKLFLRESLNQPLVLVFEDLHWIDSETQGFLDTLSESVASASVILLVNYRPEYCHEWGGKTYYTQLRLAPLGKGEAIELLTFLLGNDASLNQLKPLILEKTEGTPFFLEEVVQTLAEEGALTGERGNYRLESTPTELHISPTVQGVLAARIDRLAAGEKALLQQLSVIGRQFPVSLIKQVVAQPEAELYRVLSSLQAKEFLYEQPAFPETEYFFKHALTQEVAYGTVLQEQRKALHERTGHALEVLYTESLEEHYSDLAHHYSLSSEAKKAVDYLQLAGQQAALRSANKEAVNHLKTALAVLETLPNTPERVHQELTLQLALGTPLIATQGYGTPEVERLYSRARELCRQVGDSSQLYPVLWGLWIFYIGQCRFETAQEMGQQLLALAQKAQDSALLVESYYVLTATSYWPGEVKMTLDYAERVLALYDSQQHRALALDYVFDPGVACHTYMAFALWVLGYPEQALHRADAALTLAHGLAHPTSLAFALNCMSWICNFRRDGQAAQQAAEACVELSTAEGIRSFLDLANVHLGWALAEQGQSRAGLVQLSKAVGAWRASGTLVSLTHILATQAEAYGKGGQPSEGLSILTESLGMVQRTGERFWEAELHRLKGELVLQQSQENCSTVEACFHRALAVARRQQAKSLELRAATSLACLWQSQGKTAQARDLLTPVYNWFTEGFDTADLQDAKALLEEL